MKLHTFFSLFVLVFSPALSFIPASAEAKDSVVKAVESSLSTPRAERKQLSSQKWADQALTKQQEDQIAQILLTDRLAQLQVERKKEFDQKSITIGDQTMRYKYRKLVKKLTVVIHFTFYFTVEVMCHLA